MMVPGMLYAAYEKCGVLGGTVATHNARRTQDHAWHQGRVVVERPADLKPDITDVVHPGRSRPGKRYRDCRRHVVAGEDGSQEAEGHLE